MRSPKISWSARCVAVLSGLLLGVAANAERFDVYPYDASGDCDEPFERMANALQPGDELVVHHGVYTQSCARSIEVRGTPSQPILIRAADGAHPTFTRPADRSEEHNNIEIVNSAHLTVRGLRFFGGSIGVRFIGGSDLTFEHNEVAATASSAITINSGDATRLKLRHNHIHHSGQSRNVATTGEGIYAGCNRATCTVSDSLFEYNHIHHLRATARGGNDGIEIKPGSGGNVIRYNRIHDTTIGRAFPCIFVYGNSDRPNLVHDNHVARCGEAIQVVADAMVFNNTVLDSSIAGIVSMPHAQVGAPRNVTIRNNVVAGHPMCVQIDWRKASKVALRRNTLRCAGSTAVRAAGLGNALVEGNVYTGKSDVLIEGLARER